VQQSITENVIYSSRHFKIIRGGCHDYADAEWIVIRRPLRGHNDTLFGWPNPTQPINCKQVGHTQGVFGVCNYFLTWSENLTLGRLATSSSRLHPDGSCLTATMPDCHACLLPGLTPAAPAACPSESPVSVLFVSWRFPLRRRQRGQQGPLA
jgi:hypothetical protein